jgi:hypothetical protein
MRYLGIDPGKEGAIGAVDERGRCIEVLPIPLLTAEKGGREEFDLVEIRAVLHRHMVETSGAVFVTLEKLSPLPRSMGGAYANYARGLSHGWEWMLVAMEIPYQLVGPLRWQRVMLADTAGDTGRRSIQVAKRLWPTVSLRRTTRSRKDDHGFADSLLLADWGRREHQGAHATAATASA